MVARQADAVGQKEKGLPKAPGFARRPGRLNGQENEKGKGGRQLSGQHGKQQPCAVPVRAQAAQQKQQRQTEINNAPRGHKGNGGLKRQGEADAPRHKGGKQVCAAVKQDEQQGKQGGKGEGEGGIAAGGHGAGF